MGTFKAFCIRLIFGIFNASQKSLIIVISIVFSEDAAGAVEGVVRDGGADERAVEAVGRRGRGVAVIHRDGPG